MRSTATRDALRQLATPKWVALTLLVIALSVGFASASSWQYQRAVAQVDAQRAAASVPVPIADLVPEGPDGSTVPSSALGRLALVHGSYVGSAWVVNRAAPDGSPGVWLVSAVDDGSGTLTVVLRGWLPGRTDPTALPGAQPQSIVGRVSSPENFYTGVATGTSGELVAITAEGLKDLWGGSVRAGYLVLVDQEPALTASDPVPVKAAFGEDHSAGFPWQNAGYALQWLAFIGFIGFMFARMFADDLRRTSAPGASQVESPGVTEPSVAGPTLER